jgi:hypothetical protein
VRARILTAVEAGVKKTDIAHRFHCDRRTIYKPYTSKSYVWALQEGLVPVYEPGNVFQQDNARIHTAKWSTDWLKKTGIWTIGWPAYSSNLDPIKHLWYHPRKKVIKIHPELSDGSLFG